MEYGIDVFDENGVKVVGFDNPTTIIDNVARIYNVMAYDPPVVNGFTVKFHDQLIKVYPQRDGVRGLTCLAYYNDLSGQQNATPYCMGWYVMEIG